MVGTTSLTAAQETIDPTTPVSPFNDNDQVKQALTAGLVDAIVVDLPTALYITAAELDGGILLGQLPDSAGGDQFGLVLDKGSALTAAGHRRGRRPARGRHAGRPRGGVAHRRRGCTGPASDAGCPPSASRSGTPTAAAVPAGRPRSPSCRRSRSSPSPSSRSRPPPAGRGSRRRSSTGRSRRRRSPRSSQGLWLNIRVMAVSAVLIVIVAMGLALARTLRGPVFFPVRALATGYVDVFRGLPLILVLLLVGFGLPGLRLQGIPTSAVALGTLALVLTYSAYVAEVFRAGIESVHPSQVAAARSLGLTPGAGDAARGAPPGGPARGPAAAERPGRAVQGLRAHLDPRAPSTPSAPRRSRPRATPTSRRTSSPGCCSSR